MITQTKPIFLYSIWLYLLTNSQEPSKRTSCHMDSYVLKCVVDGLGNQMSVIPSFYLKVRIGATN